MKGGKICWTVEWIDTFKDAVALVIVIRTEKNKSIPITLNSIIISNDKYGTFPLDTWWKVAVVMKLKLTGPQWSV